MFLGPINHSSYDFETATNQQNQQNNVTSKEIGDICQQTLANILQKLN